MHQTLNNAGPAEDMSGGAAHGIINHMETDWTEAELSLGVYSNPGLLFSEVFDHFPFVISED